MRLDSYSSIRIAAYPLWRDHLIAPQGIFTDANAVQLGISGSAIRTALTCNSDGWSGMDAPEKVLHFTPATSSQGEQLSTIPLVKGRRFNIPIWTPTDNPSLLDALDDEIHASQPVIVGFDHAEVARRRYLIGSWWQGPFNRGYRGHQPLSDVPIPMKSQWGWLVEPVSQPAAQTFTPSGKTYIVWSVELSNITSPATITIAPSGATPAALTGLPALTQPQSMRFTFADGAIPNRLLVCPSHPFRQYQSYDSATALSVHRFTARTGALPEYLQPGQAYNISVVGADANIVWLRNHARPE